jgi:hypothetical protein
MAIALGRSAPLRFHVAFIFFFFFFFASRSTRAISARRQYS